MGDGRVVVGMATSQPRALGKAGKGGEKLAEIHSAMVKMRKNFRRSREKMVKMKEKHR